jgi:D-lactate dehydrogenase (cytochrome)
VPSHVVRSRPPRGAASHAQPDRDPERLRSYLEDAAHVPGGHADGIVFPRTEADVAAVLGGGRPVLPIGAQSSLTGGATPMGEVLLSTARLTTIEVGPRRAMVGPGVTLASLDAALRAQGAWYPPVPTFTGATVGGVVSTNAAGAATFKYGATRAWVEELTVVLADGDVLDLRRGEVHAHVDGYFEIERSASIVRVPVPDYRMPRVPKVSAGYYAAPGMDLIDLFIGAEGTLGVVTSVTLRTESPRPSVALALVNCPTRHTGLRLAADLRTASGMGVAAIEHMDRKSLELLREDHVDAECQVTLPADAELLLIVTLEVVGGLDSSQAFEEIGRALDEVTPNTPLVQFCRLLSRADVLDRAEIALPDDHARQAQFIALREAVPAAVNQRIGRAQRTIDPRIAKMAADVIVPHERLADLLDLCDAEFARRGLAGAVWGHISDGNLHPNVVPRSFDEYVAGSKAVLTIGRAAIGWGGSPCAEHGVGRHAVKQQLVRDLYGDSGVAAMHRVKAALDPRRRLAPGVLGL